MKYRYVCFYSLKLLILTSLDCTNYWYALHRMVVLPCSWGIWARRNATETQVVWPHFKIWTRDQRWKKFCQNAAPKRFRCRSVK